MLVFPDPDGAEKINSLPLDDSECMLPGDKNAQQPLNAPKKAEFQDYLRTVWAYFLFGLYLVLHYPLVLFLSILRKDSGSVIFVRCTRTYLKIMLRLCGIRVVYKNREILSRYSAYVLVSNHSSLLDVLAAGLAVPDNFKGLAKKEISRIPFLRLYFNLVAVYVDRSDAESRARSLERCTQVLRSGHPLLIFPEGTRNRTNSVLLPFRDGAFKMAIRAQCPVIPFLLPDNRFLMPMRNPLLRKGTLRIHYLDPISTHDLTLEDVSYLREKVRAFMEENLKLYFEGLH